MAFLNSGAPRANDRRNIPLSEFNNLPETVVLIRREPFSDSIKLTAQSRSGEPLSVKWVSLRSGFDSLYVITERTDFTIERSKIKDGCRYACIMYEGETLVARSSLTDPIHEADFASATRAQTPEKSAVLVEPVTSAEPVVPVKPPAPLGPATMAKQATPMRPASSVGPATSTKPAPPVRPASDYNPTIVGNTHTWQTISYGRYPQSEILPDTQEYAALAVHEWSSGEPYATINGQQYFRLAYEAVNPAAFGGTGEAEKAWEGKTHRYFRVEPIRWRILSATDVPGADKIALLLLSDLAIDCKCYHHYGKNTTWATATLRQWMNSEDWAPVDSGVKKYYYTPSFCSLAFTADELSLIQPIPIDDVSPETDKVSLLNNTQAFNTQFGFLRDTDADRPNQIFVLSATDYAIACGSDHLTEVIDGKEFHSLCGWALREPGRNPNQVSGFDSNGQHQPHGYTVRKDGFEGGLRPVVCLQLSRDRFVALLAGEVNADHGETTTRDVEYKPLTIELCEQILASVINDDFKSTRLQDIQSKCVELFYYYEQELYEDFCAESRKLAESICRYLYERLVDNESNRFPPNLKNFGSLISDSAFLRALGDEMQMLIYYAEEINRISRSYHHDDDKGKDADFCGGNGVTMRERVAKYRDNIGRKKPSNNRRAEEDAHSVYRRLFEFLTESVKCINERVSYVRGRLTIEYFIHQTNSSPFLVAKLTDVDDASLYDFRWERKDLSDKPIYTGRGSPNQYYLKLPDVNHTLVCKVTHKKTGHSITAEYGPITKEEVGNDSAGSGQRSDVTSSKGSSSSFATAGFAKLPQTFAKAEFDKLPQTLMIEKSTDNELYLTAKDSSGADVRGYYASWRAKDATLFVFCYTDKFWPNPEKIGDGCYYACIVCEDGRIVGRSDLVLVRKSDFDAMPVAPQQKDTPAPKTDARNAEPQPDPDRTPAAAGVTSTPPKQLSPKPSVNSTQIDRVRYLVADKDELFFVNSLEKLDLGGLIRRMLAEDGYSKVVMATNPEEAQSALAGPEKAAVVLPLAKLRKGSDLDVEKAGALASALQSGSEDSILLVTCELTDSLFMLSRREPFKALDPDGATLNKDSDRVLVVREQPDADEIGNLLLRKKIVEGKLDWLSYDKLYPAAEYLCSTYQNMSAKELYTTVLEDPEKVEEMRQKVVKTYDVVPCVNIHTTALTRFGRGVKRWNDPNAKNQSR